LPEPELWRIGTELEYGLERDMRLTLFSKRWCEFPAYCSFQALEMACSVRAFMKNAGKRTLMIAYVEYRHLRPLEVGEGVTVADEEDEES